MDNKLIGEFYAAMLPIAANQPVDFMLAAARLVHTLDPEAIRSAIPVYAKRQADMGLPLTKDYIRAMNLLLDAAKTLVLAGAAAETEWRECVSQWPRRN